MTVRTSVFMRYINEVAKKMARNGLKIAKSLGCAFHFESEFTQVENGFSNNEWALGLNLVGYHALYQTIN